MQRPLSFAQVANAAAAVSLPPTATNHTSLATVVYAPPSVTALGKLTVIDYAWCWRPQPAEMTSRCPWWTDRRSVERPTRPSIWTRPRRIVRSRRRPPHRRRAAPRGRDRSVCDAPRPGASRRPRLSRSRPRSGRPRAVRPPRPATRRPPGRCTAPACRARRAGWSRTRWSSATCRARTVAPCNLRRRSLTLPTRTPIYLPVHRYVQVLYTCTGFLIYGVLNFQ